MKSKAILLTALGCASAMVFLGQTPAPTPAARSRVLEYGGCGREISEWIASKCKNPHPSRRRRGRRGTWRGGCARRSGPRRSGPRRRWCSCESCRTAGAERLHRDSDSRCDCGRKKWKSV